MIMLNDVKAAAGEISSSGRVIQSLPLSMHGINLS